MTDLRNEFRDLHLSGVFVMGWDVTIYNPDLYRDGSAAARIVRYLGESLDAARLQGEHR